MIAFTCPGCGQKLTIKDEFAGKIAACPHCKQRMQAPAGPTAVASNAAAPVPDRTVGDNATLPPVGNPPVPSWAGREELAFLASPQGPDELGRLGQYRIVKVLGEGGMGMVLLAEDLVLKRSVALKVMRPELAAHGDARQRFLREAQAMAAIEHPHIVHVYQVGEDQGAPFLAMPFLKGEPLDERLKREKKLAVAEAVHLSRQIAEGLAAAHEHGLIHRDIKPANIWLEPHVERGEPALPWVKVLDFGLARAATDKGQLTKSGMIVGTPAYMSPEQARGEKVDARCDLFSLGAVLYSMLTGEQPFKGSDTMSLLMALATEEPRPVRELRPETPAALADLVKRLLAKDPARRPTSARAVADTLAEIEEDGLPMPPLDLDVAAPARRVTASAKQREKGRPRWILPAAGGGLLLALLVLAMGIFGSSGGEKKKGDSPELLAAKDGRNDVEKEWGKEIENSIGMKLVRIPAGKFTMGSPPDEKVRFPNEEQHEVEITKAFWLGVHEVSQKEFIVMMGYKPSFFSHDGEGKTGVTYRDEPAGGKDKVPADTSNFPVENVSYEEAEEFCKKLTGKETDRGRVYRLPSEAEWEYACRGDANSSTSYHTGDTLTSSQANFNRNMGHTCKVGSYKANAFGLYDMHGNVWEWCSDWFGEDYYGKSPPRDPLGPIGGSGRVLRGGSWFSNEQGCMSAYRSSSSPAYRDHSLGFRVALIPLGR